MTKYLLILIVIIAAFLRLYNIIPPVGGLPPGLYPDEAMNGNNALEAISTRDYKVFYPENNGREGLFINIQALSIALFGNFPWALRIVSAIFGILTVLGIYFLAKEIFNKNIALLSAFLLATSFWHINFSRIGFRAIMAPFFLTWGIYFLLKSLNNWKLEIGNWKLPILGGLAYGLGFHSYIAYRATPLLILIIIALYWFQNKKWETRKKILLAASGYILMAIIVFAPLGIYFIQNPQDFMGRTTQVSVFSSPTPIKDLTMNILKTTSMFNFSGDWNWRHNYAGKPLLFWPVGIFFIIGIILGIRQLFKFQMPSAKSQTIFNNQNPNNQNLSSLKFRISNLFEICNLRFVILFAWLIIAALPVVISNEGLPHALRAILMVPPVFILAGFGGIWMYEKILATINSSKINLLHWGVAIFIIILIIQSYQSYFIDWGKNPNVQGAFAADYVQIGRELNKLPKKTPKYVIVEADGADVRGIPMPTQTIMFITDTFTPKKQKEKNIFYILPDKINQIPQNSYTVILK